MRRTLLTILVLILFAPNPGRADQIDDLQKKLRHFDYKERLRALDRLEQIGGKDAAIAATGAVADEDWSVQIRALEVLGKLKVPETAETAAKAIIDGEILLVRIAAQDAVKSMGVADMYERLLRGVARGRAETPKIRALDAAGALAGPDDVKIIAPFTADREKKIRAAAYFALGATENPEALKYLLRGIRDKAISVRARSMEALGGIGGEEAMQGILSVVLTDLDPYILERAARAFRRFDPAAAAAWLEGAARGLRRPEERARAVSLLAELRSEAAAKPLIGWLGDPDPATRAFAARGVGWSGAADGVEPLAPLLDNDPDSAVRRAALEAMVRLLPKDDRLGVLLHALKNASPLIRVRACVLLEREGDPTILKEVFPLVGDRDWFVATAAIITIGRLGHEDEVAALTPGVTNRDWKVRAATIEALGLLRHMDAIPYLCDAIGDPDPIVRSAALKNLKVLAQQDLGDDQAAWRKWYEENKDDYELTKKGYRETVEDDYYGKSKYLIEILNRAQIVCVLGKWDHAEIVLEHLGIKQTIIRPQDIKDIGLNPKQLLLLNCEGTIGKKEAIERLQWFVHVGGYLMATDWALTNAVTRAFPGYVDMDSKSKTGNDVVEIEPAAPDHPLLKGVFDRGTNLRWWLEVIAFPMKVVDPIRTVVLVDSLEMLEKYNASTMAAVFDYGHGKVEQCVSHFYLQEEGLASVSTLKERKIFAADSLGISLDQIRQLEAKGFFDGAITESLTKEIAEDYSMFKLIVNFVVEKRRQVEQN